MLSSDSLPSLPILISEKEKKGTLIDMGNMEDAGHGYAVFSLDSQTKQRSVVL